PGATTGLYDAGGRRVLGQGPSVADGAVRAALGGDVGSATDGGDLVAAVPVISGGQVIGVVRVATAQAALTGRLLASWAGMTALALAAVAAAAALAHRQARRLAAPLEQLAAAAAALGGGNFTVRAAPSGIPEIDVAATAVNTTAGRLGELVARERAFSADASHQLRTPLTRLRLELETALAGEPAGLPAAAARAIDAVDQLEATIDDLLALARDVPGQREELDVTDLLAQLRAQWHGPLAAAGRPLRLQTDGEVPAPRAARAAVWQILQVLVDNAARHGRGAVTVTVRDAGGAVAVDVTDEGPGVAGRGEEVFRRRAPGSAGHGIGLALARALAEAEGGRLLLSRPGPGPVFTLLLPAPPARVPARAHSRAPAKVPVRAPAGAPPRRVAPPGSPPGDPPAARRRPPGRARRAGRRPGTV
ncbi:MAG: sensor histidine kinase, partial [Actinomycetota bacterium]